MTVILIQPRGNLRKETKIALKVPTELFGLEEVTCQEIIQGRKNSSI